MATLFLGVILASSVAIQCRSLDRDVRPNWLTSLSAETAVVEIAQNYLEIALCDRFTVNGGEVKLKLLKQATHIAKTTDIENKIALHEIGSINSGRVRAVSLDVTGKALRTSWYTVEVLDEAWVTVRNLKRGQVIRAEDIQFTVTNVARVAGGYQLLEGSPVGLVTTRTIRHGRVVSTQDVAAPPLVERNMMVIITVKSGRIKLSSPGVALSMGWEKGDLVSVLVDGAESPIKAYVIGENKVEMAF